MLQSVGLKELDMTEQLNKNSKGASTGDTVANKTGNPA